MWKSIKQRFRKTAIIPLLSFIALLLLWTSYYLIGFQTFDRTHAISIFTSVIAGMSALLSIALAVIIFRIQTLENRRHALEESILNFILYISGMTYPQWIPSVEEAIKSGSFTTTYYNRRVASLGLNQSGYNERVKEYAEDRDTQQERLMEAIKLHSTLSQRIQRIRKNFIPKMLFLVLPIIMGLFMFMLSDALNTFGNFFIASALVLLSTIGITLLIQMLVDSVAED